MEVRASHILVKSKEKAEEIMDKVNNGASFAKMAQEHSDCPSGKKGGDLGFFGRGRMVPAFETFCFSHQKGDTGLVKTRFGWHVVRVTDVRK
jgi:peptidyl-prolyl cis-trans isomerase C